eukprot:gene17737-12490_t
MAAAADGPARGATRRKFDDDGNYDASLSLDDAAWAAHLGAPRWSAAAAECDRAAVAPSGCQTLAPSLRVKGVLNTGSVLGVMLEPAEAGGPVHCDGGMAARATGVQYEQ